MPARPARSRRTQRVADPSASVRAQRAETVRRFASLDDPQWDVVTGARGSDGGAVRVRDVAAHLILADEALLGRRVLARMRARGEHRWDPGEIERLAELPPGELVATLARRGETVARVARATAVPATSSSDTVRGGARQRWRRRVLHEWLHYRDVSAATGDVRPPPAEVADALVRAVLSSLPDDVLPAVAAPIGTLRLVVDVDGQAGGDEDTLARAHAWGFDFARKHFGPRVLDPPDAVVWTQASGLALLAGGRSTWAELEEAGALTREGDRELCEAFLHALEERSLTADPL